MDNVNAALNALPPDFIAFGSFSFEAELR